MAGLVECCKCVHGHSRQFLSMCYIRDNRSCRLPCLNICEWLKVRIRNPWTVSTSIAFPVRVNGLPDTKKVIIKFKCDSPAVPGANWKPNQRKLHKCEKEPVSFNPADHTDSNRIHPHHLHLCNADCWKLPAACKTDSAQCLAHTNISTKPVLPSNPTDPNLSHHRR